MGQLQLVKSIIQGFLLYCFKVYSWPISLIKSLDSWICNFIWIGDIHHRKVVTAFRVIGHPLKAPKFIQETSPYISKLPFLLMLNFLVIWKLLKLLSRRVGESFGYRDSDSSLVTLAFRNSSVVPQQLINYWLNCITSTLSMQFGNYSVDKLANLGIIVQGFYRWDFLSTCLSEPYFRERVGLPS
ncbi:hypothetical protein HKD37_13G035593 [Glycine soja]